ncbi:MAG: xanthine dehydrogenase large subunit [Candidatus Azotimanducaceae bacterium]|jgi:xanthine dehydrogenase large subunit
MRKLKLPALVDRVKIEAGDMTPHESALKHVTGEALYVDDIETPRDSLHVATGQSPVACGKITHLSLAAVKNAPGVIDVITIDDVPGDPDISPVFSGDMVLANREVVFVGQPVFAVAATSFEAAKRAVKLAEIEIAEEKPILTVKEAMAAESFVLPTRAFTSGDAKAAITGAKHQLQAEHYVRGQEHFYLEGQVCLATPTEDGGVHVISSSQHPSEVQNLVASVLGIGANKVFAEVRRMGGGFGGKESQAAALACIASLFAKRTGKTVKYRMPRQDDMVQTGKRHDFWNRYHVGFDEEGVIEGVQMDLAGLCGCTADLSEGIVDRAMFHADNAYHYPAVRINGYRCKTNTVSNTAFRGFGGPKGMIAAEAMLDDIARAVGKDPFEVRLKNLYAPGRDETPYGQKVEQHMLHGMMEKLATDADYWQRRADILAFNEKSQNLRKGLALTPVKFGISFTSNHLNQAGALIHIYTDGTISVNHGGTEMGQGLYTKIAQVVATALGVSFERILVTATRTDKVPNTSPTAASAGTDLNGMAASNAAEKLKARLVGFVAAEEGVLPAAVSLQDDQFEWPGGSRPFEEVVQAAYLARVQLSATGFYKTPKIHFDKETGKGHPFFYFANGAAVSEVIVDGLTGEYRVARVDILHDVGQSINPAIDIGQIEGGFIQGMGWLTTEELLWDDTGRLISNSPANYKIPTAYDVPSEFNVWLFDEPNLEETVYRSKAVGEPPLMLALSVWCALRDAAASFADYQISPPMDAPATPEQVYRAIQAARAYKEQA